MDVKDRTTRAVANRDRSSAGGSAAFGAGRMRAGFWLVAGVYLLTMLGGALPVPLYGLWAPQMGFGPFTTTLIYAVYALGVVVSLLVFAPWSDRSGRRPSLAISMAIATASTVCFALARDVAVLLVARLLCGLATGVVTATATAAMEDLAGRRSTRNVSMIATAANLGGLGLGALIAGLFAQFTVDPTRLVFWVYLIALLAALGAVAATPETVASPTFRTLSVRRPAVPDSATPGTQFACAAATVFAVFAVNGLFTSLVPSFLRDRMHMSSAAGVGALVALLFIVALAAQAFAPLKWLRSPIVAPMFMVSGLIVFETALWTQTAPVFVVATVLAGIGCGLAFRHGVAVTARLAVPSRRANLFASYFLAAYAGAIGPTLALGLLDEAINPNLATLILAVAVGVVVAGAAAVRIRKAPRTHRAENALAQPSRKGQLP